MKDLIWAYPTHSALKAHAFPEQGAPSLCRRYILQSMELAFVVNYEDLGSRDICATCTKRAAK